MTKEITFAELVNDFDDLIGEGMAYWTFGKGKVRHWFICVGKQAYRVYPTLPNGQLGWPRMVYDQNKKVTIHFKQGIKFKGE